MYYYLHGTVTIHEKDSIVVECNGVGYEVLVSHPEDYNIGDTIRIYTAFYSREDEQFLIGFKTFEEKALYIKLISVKGVGPKSAMSILGGSSSSRVKEAIDSSDIVFLSHLPNIGPKTAKQIVLDLKGKLTYGTGVGSGDKNLDDAVIGLKNMGFRKEEIDEVMTKIPDRGLSTEDYLKKALILLSKRG